MLMRNFTKREKTVLLLLVIFLLVGLYFLVIHFPVTTRLEEIDAEMAMIEDETNIAIVKGQLYVNMKNELKDIFALPFDKITVMPAYDNQTTLFYNYQNIFDNLHPDINFGDVEFEGNVAMRNVSFTVTVSSFEEAKTFVNNLTGTGFRCLLENITVTPAEGSLENDAITLSGNIMFYELVGSDTNNTDNTAE